MIKKGKEEKGITLVALTITVLIMAVLVGVVIKASTKDDLIDTAMNVADDFDSATVFQALNNILVSERSVYENGFIDEQTMWKNIKKSIEGDSETAKELKECGSVYVYEESRTEGDSEEEIITALIVYVNSKGYKMDIHHITEL